MDDNERRSISNQAGRINTRRSGALYSPLESYTNCRCKGGNGVVRKKAPHLCGAGCTAADFHFPVPVRVEVCGLLLALSLTLNVPVLFPVAVGVKVTLILHVDLAARLVAQVVAETLKSPVVEITMPFSATLCLLVRVNTFARLVVPTIRAA